MSEPIVLSTSEALQAAVPRGRCLQGSGVLCWARCPETGEVHFLLGKECDNQRRSHRNKLRGWCDFGGCSKRFQNGSESAAQTAAREFVEETCNMVPLGGVPTNCKTVQQDLLQGKFDFVVTTKANKGKRRYVCFVCQVDWDPDIPTKFSNVRSVLSHMYQDASYVHQLHRQVPHSAPYYRPGMTLASSVGLTHIVSGVPLQAPALVRAVLDVQWDGDCLKVLLETQQDGDTQQRWHSCPVQADDKFVTRYVAWVKCRQQLLKNYQALPLEVRHHASVRVQYKYGNIYSLAVNADYLEKSDVAWWSLADLERELEDGGRYNPFRPCFRSVIRLAVQHFKEAGVKEVSVKEAGGFIEGSA